VGEDIERGWEKTDRGKTERVGVRRQRETRQTERVRGRRQRNN